MGRSRAMMIQAGFSQQDERKFWCEVISTATKLDNIMVRKEMMSPKNESMERAELTKTHLTHCSTMKEQDI